MRLKIKGLVIVLAGFCFGLLSAVAWSDDASAINIGVIYNLTGSMSHLDQASMDGARLAVAELNQTGGVLGQPLHLVVKDTGGDVKTVVQLAGQLAFDKHIAVMMGLNNDNMLAAAMPAIKTSSKLFVSSGVSNGMLAKQYPDHLFLLGVSDVAQGQAAARFAIQQHKKSALVVYTKNGMFTHATSQAFTDAFKPLGGRVVVKLPVSQKTVWPAALLVHRAQIKHVDVIYLAVASKLVIPAIQSLRAAGWKQMIVGPDSFSLPALTAAVNAKQVKNVFYTSRAYLGPGADSKSRVFIRAYQKRYHLPPTDFSAMAYDTVFLIAQAISNAGTLTLKDMQQGMENIRRYVGVSGTYHFSSGNNISHRPVNIVTVSGGQLKLVTRIHLA